MTSRPLLFAALGLAAGIAAGALTSPSGGGPAMGDTAPVQPHLGPVAAIPAATLRLAFPGDDGRIARVFSALQQPVLLLRRYELVEALQDVTAEELPPLVKHAESLRRKAGSELLGALVERWFQVDPAAAQAWARTGSMNLRTIQLWGRADPERAFQAAAASDEQWASDLLVASLEGLCGNDVAAQLAKARTLPQDQLRDRVLSRLIVALARQDPARAYASLDELGNTREQARYDLLQGWASSEPAGALAKLGDLLFEMKVGVLGNAYVTNTVEQIAGDNPELVLDWLGGIPSELRSPIAIAAARQWARREPIPALEWCLANGVEISRPRYRAPAMQSTILAEAMERAPAETFALLEALPPGADRDRLLECAFISSLQKMEGDGQKGAGWSIYQQLPEEAQIANAALFGEARARQGNLEDVGAWAQNFPAGQSRSNAVAGAIGAAYERDAVHARALLASLTAATDRDAALRGLVGAMSRTSSADAATRALEIRDSTVQQDVLEAVLLRWLKSDPAAGRKWLEGAAAVPATWKQEWLQRQ